jgi:hypothetical protein
MKALRILPFIAALFIASCSKSDMSLGDYPTAGAPETDSDSDPDGGGNSMAGIVTAGEWNDLDNWGFWNELMSGQNEEKFYEYLNYWSLYTSNRFAVTVVDATGAPVCGAKVELFVNDAQKSSWTAITDNSGSAELWYNIGSSGDTDEEKTFTAAVNGVKISDPLSPTYNFAEEVSMNTLVAEQVTTVNSADIAFIVDATGSMYDEIDFLKEDLLDIIQRASANTTRELRTAALFYRDKGDAYLTRHEDFNKDPEKTLKFIQKQKAGGGGDYPEAVHTALERALQNLSWREGSYAKIAFLLLDAPPHHDKDVLASLKNSIELYAANGIKIIPIAASGVDKNTEFILRLMAIYTDGTYTFITNHSGVGNDHIEPTIGQYQVEQLNDLIIRLIQKYTE